MCSRLIQSAVRRIRENDAAENAKYWDWSTLRDQQLAMNTKCHRFISTHLDDKRFTDRRTMLFHSL